MTIGQTFTFHPMNIKATVQFGNSFDTHGFEIKEAEILGKRVGGFCDVYIVRDGNKIGSATFRESNRSGTLTNFYHCTSAMPMGSRFTPEFVAKHYGIPVELIA